MNRRYDENGPGNPEPASDLYRELFEQSADAILILQHGAIVDCNDAAVSLLGYAAKRELLGLHPAEFSPSRQPDQRSSREHADELIDLAFARGSCRFEWMHRRADGAAFPAEVLLTAIGDPSTRRLHAVLRDITERKRLETALNQAQKLEAIGRLAGGVAHDFNNLLVSILGHAELLEEALADHVESRPHLEEIRRSGRRAAELVDQLLAFGRKQENHPRVIDLNVLLGDIMRLLGRVIGERIEIVTDLAGDQLLVVADPMQLERVVINLATNARDAMPGGGRITLRTRPRELAPADVPSAPHLAPGSYVELAVTDTGEGIDPALHEHIFEPFFTTKAPGQGTGLGLASVFGVVRQGGGDIAVESEPGRGTTMRVLLPRSEQSLPRPTAKAAADDATDGGQRILLAEDECGVARLMEEVLVRAGYEVSVYRNGAEVLEQADAGTYDLLVTDVVMPGVDGIALARQLRERRPDLPVLFISGYNNSLLTGGTPTDQQVNLLLKPFEPRELLHRVRESLAPGSCHGDC